MSVRKPTRRSSPVHVAPAPSGGAPGKATPTTQDEALKARWKHEAELRQSKVRVTPAEKSRRKPPIDLPL